MEWLWNKQGIGELGDAPVYEPSPDDRVEREMNDK